MIPKFSKYAKINEIGDKLVDPLKWKFDKFDKQKRTARYLAKSDKLKDSYFILFSENSATMRKDFNPMQNPLEYYDLVFALEKGGFGDITNAGEFFPLISAVLEILKDFIKEFAPKIVTFSGSYKDDENSKSSETQRTRLYFEYIRKQLKKIAPRGSMEKSGNRIIIFVDTTFNDDEKKQILETI